MTTPSRGCWATTAESGYPSTASFSVSSIAEVVDLIEAKHDKLKSILKTRYLIDSESSV